MWLVENQKLRRGVMCGLWSVAIGQLWWRAAPSEPQPSAESGPQPGLCCLQARNDRMIFTFLKGCKIKIKTTCDRGCMWPAKLKTFALSPLQKRAADSRSGWLSDGEAESPRPPTPKTLRIIQSGHQLCTRCQTLRGLFTHHVSFNSGIR